MLRRQAIWLLFATAIFATQPVVATAGEVSNGAKAFIESLADDAIKSLTSTELTRVERKKRFHALINRYFAIKSIAKWVVGRHWRRATPEQRTEYLALFENMLVERYVDGFKDYSGETLDVTSVEQRAAKDYIVHTKLLKPGATKAVDVGWRVGVGSHDGKTFYKVVDVIVNGLSMSVTQQKEFNAVIKNNGNSVEALLVKMREMAHAPS